MEKWKKFDNYPPLRVLVIFLPLLWYVWMCSIRSCSHWNMLLHSEWVNLYVTASRVGSSFDGEPCLICLWLQRGLRHAGCPCSALINGFGEREEGEKVCVRPRQRLWGFSQLNYIKRQSPADTHTHTVHTYSTNKYEYEHIRSALSQVLMSMNILTGTFPTHTLGGIHWHKPVMRWEAFLFRLLRKGWLLPLALHPPAERAPCLHSNATPLSFRLLRADQAGL